jgi:hypothetical protein
VTDTTDSLVEPAYDFREWVPAAWDLVNSLQTAEGPSQRLVVIPAQFSATANDVGTMRVFDELSYTVYYSDSADVWPPTFWVVGDYRDTDDDARQIVVEVTDQSGVGRVGIGYTTGDGWWHTLDLTRLTGDPDIWTGSLPDAENLRFFVQAVDMAGNVATETNKHNYFGDAPQAQALLLTAGVESTAVSPAVPTVIPVTITNLGDAPDTYDLMVTPPVGWEAELLYNGNPAFHITVANGAANQAQLQVRVIPPANDPAGEYLLAVTAISQSNPAIIAEATVDLTLEAAATADLTLRFSPAALTTVDTTAQFGLVLTNTGSAPTNYDLSVTVLGGSAELQAAQVDLPAGEGRTIPVTVAVPGPGSYVVEATAVLPGGGARTATAVLTVEPDTRIFIPLILHTY